MDFPPYSWFNLAGVYHSSILLFIPLPGFKRLSRCCSSHCGPPFAKSTRGWSEKERPSPDKVLLKHTNFSRNPASPPQSLVFPPSRTSFSRAQSSFYWIWVSEPRPNNEAFFFNEYTPEAHLVSHITYSILTKAEARSTNSPFMAHQIYYPGSWKDINVSNLDLIILMDSHAHHEISFNLYATFSPARPLY